MSQFPARDRRSSDIADTFFATPKRIRWIKVKRIVIAIFSMFWDKNLAFASCGEHQVIISSFAPDISTNQMVTSRYNSKWQIFDVYSSLDYPFVAARSNVKIPRVSKMKKCYLWILVYNILSGLVRYRAASAPTVEIFESHRITNTIQNVFRR